MSSCISNLELRILPAMVCLLFALLMLYSTYFYPSWPWALFWRVGTMLIMIILGSVIGFAGVLAFRSARTTVNPVHPERAAVLVTQGIYRYTRNPMYLGLLCILIGWGFFLANPVAPVGVLGFVAYMTRFQIVPEERALQILFGDEFIQYQKAVRRWL